MPHIDANSESIVRSKSVRLEATDVFERLASPERADRTSLGDQKSSSKSFSMASSPRFPVESAAPITNRSFKARPGTAATTHRKRSSVSSRSESEHRPDRFMMNDDIGIRLYRAAVEARDTRRSKGQLPEFVQPHMKRSMSVKDRSGLDLSGFRVAPEDSLEARYAEQLQRLNLAKEKEEERIKKDCTFRPQLSERSVRLAQRARSMCSSKSLLQNAEDLLGDDDVFAALYRTQKVRMGQQPMPAGCTFRPDMTRSKSFKYLKRKDYVAQPVVDRLVKSKSFRDQALKQKREEEEKKELTVDQKTGQQLYRPRITRGPKKPVADFNKPLHERLYRDSYLERKKLQDETRARQRWQGMKAKSYSMKQSEKLLKAARKKKCAEIFKLLDPDDCGSINSGHIRLDCNLMLCDER